MKRFSAALVAVLSACSFWEYGDPSSPLDNTPPETFLTLAAADTLYARIDTIIVRTDPETGQEISDTVWTYAIGEDPDPGVVWDTLTSAFSTITTSRQELHWWGEDPDGHVVGYRYRWNVDTTWTFSTHESAVFFLPVTREMDVFTFQVAAVDEDSLVDPTPAKVVLPIRNSKPSVSFRYRSNPLVDNPSDTSFTFPTRTFVWDVEDQDGIETVTDIFYALDDTCGACWTGLDAAFYSSITLTGISPGTHTFFLKARDIAGAESGIIHFPDVNDPSTPNTWTVMPVVGEMLLVDDFPQDTKNGALKWYAGILDSLAGSGSYSVWEIGEDLPFSSTDVNANLNYFDHVIWYTAYTGVETYHDAGASILQFIAGGGNIFLNTAELKDTSFVWFPMDSTFVLNRSGRLFSGRVLISQVDTTLNLEISKLIAIRVQGFETSTATAPHFSSLYRLQEPESGDEWLGTPNVCGKYQFELEPGLLSGKAVLMSIPLHNGSEPLLEGKGSAGKFISYLLKQEFGL